MGPRKRTKPNPKPEAESQSKVESEVHPPKDAANASESVFSKDGAASDGANDGRTLPQSSKTWYGGTWPRGVKATPITQVAKESISAAGGAASEVVASARAHTPPLSTTPLMSPAGYLSRQMGSSSRSLPLAATTTKLNITSSANSPVNGTAKEGHKDLNGRPLKQEQKSVEEGASGLKSEKPNDVANVTQNFKKDMSVSGSRNKSLEDTKSSNESASWLAWFSKTESAKAQETDGTKKNDVECEPTHTGKDRPHSTISEAPKHAPISIPQRRNSEPSPTSPVIQRDEQTRSWLGLWGNVSTQKKATSSVNATGVVTTDSHGSEELAAQDQRPEAATNDSIATPRPLPEPEEPAKTYGWAFWSKDEVKDSPGKRRSESKFGELALAGSPSQSKPEKTIVDESRGIPSKVEKRQRPQSLEITEETNRPQAGKDYAGKDSKSGTGDPAPVIKSSADAHTKTKKEPKNLLLPSFKRTYRTAARPGIIQQLTRLFHLGPVSDPKHVDLVSSPPRIKSALAIGVHGYFPAPLIRSVLGQPTGTSIRFANSAASAIQKWTQDHGYSCEIEKVALEGEGKIAERIDLLWKLLLNWIDKIRKADFVMIACHSQGVPVAMILVAKLIAFGCVNSAKIGVCAMAGVNLGPFADYKSRWISGSAGELFDFARPDSHVSKDYEAALDVALRFGVKIIYVGSIDDQLVSLESSTFGTLSHPSVYRAVFVDGRVHAPDFLTHLVGFALKLRNLGISDHGLIRELSSPLAGSLYGGEGHSRIYDEESVYYLAVEHALETTAVENLPLQMQRDGASNSQNPYILPFAMRGLLEEDYVRTELYGEISELIKQFDDWKPSSKVLKDVKFRLEGVRSKL